MAKSVTFLSSIKPKVLDDSERIELGIAQKSLFALRVMNAQLSLKRDSSILAKLRAKPLVI
ncbi:hypothetical protein EPI10_015543 [Gossypium australe]|uniref:Uncharacterized protein n=1 Tax=Gossypium australe TaxID=47621 RepID=A0A5B6VL76_9ROSI|nr:hypothetical protein EPI10_015543 [Gossypium australe]